MGNKLGRDRETTLSYEESEDFKRSQKKKKLDNRQQQQQRVQILPFNSVSVDIGFVSPIRELLANALTEEEEQELKKQSYRARLAQNLQGMDITEYASNQEKQLADQLEGQTELVENIRQDFKNLSRDNKMAQIQLLRFLAFEPTNTFIENTQEYSELNFNNSQRNSPIKNEQQHQNGQDDFSSFYYQNVLIKQQQNHIKSNKKSVVIGDFQDIPRVYNCAFLRRLFKVCGSLLDANDTTEYLDYSKILQLMLVLSENPQDEKHYGLFSGLVDFNEEGVVEGQQLFVFLSEFFEFLCQTPFGEAQHEMEVMRNYLLDQDQNHVNKAMGDIAQQLIQEYSDENGKCTYNQWKQLLDQQFHLSQLLRSTKRLLL